MVKHPMLKHANIVYDPVERVNLGMNALFCLQGYVTRFLWDSKG